MRQLLLFGLGLLPALTGAASSNCTGNPATLHLTDPPYDDFFYSDCYVDAQVVVTTPQPDSNLTQIGPRLIIAWPGGNSGVCAFFAPQNGVNGSLAIEVVNSTVGTPLTSIYEASSSTSQPPRVGTKGVISFNSSAILTVPILGSVRTIRDFTEGPSLLQPEIQNAIEFSSISGGGASLRRLWLDNITTTYFNFTPTGSGTHQVTVDNRTLKFDAGQYVFAADLNYAQLDQLTPTQVLNPNSTDLIKQYPDQTTALSFFSYTNKLLAGGWRFLTYFGRDSMISALLLEPVLSYGQGGAVEAVIGAVLERMNRSDGSICHEETIGDYATWVNQEDNITSTAPYYSYIMIDSDYYLPTLMKRYFLDNPVGKTRKTDFLKIAAGSINPANKNLTYGQLAQINANKIMTLAAPFAGKHNQTQENLVHLKEDQIVGQWRDSTYGIGGGRIPYDVNTALMPAALRSIAALARAGFYEKESQWGTLADKYAQVWEDETLQFFQVTIPQQKAQQLLTSYKKAINFTGPSEVAEIDSDVKFHAISLHGYDNLAKVEVMNTDDCFRHFLLNTTNQAQLTAFVNQTANNIRRTFPAGLTTGAGMVVANPAYGENPVYAQNWTAGAYHGTVVWSWPLAMMAKGLELQLGRCQGDGTKSSSSPDFCSDTAVYNNVKNAYNILWNTIEANNAQLSQEVWSWIYTDGKFQVEPLGVMPPPPGTGSQTESDIRQLWSLTFLAVTRDETLK